jgi:hypothetical protein
VFDQRVDESDDVLLRRWIKGERNDGVGSRVLDFDGGIAQGIFPRCSNPQFASDLQGDGLWCWT